MSKTRLKTYFSAVEVIFNQKQLKMTVFHTHVDIIFERCGKAQILSINIVFIGCG